MPVLHDAPCPTAGPPLHAPPSQPAQARHRLDIGPACFVVLASHLYGGRLAPCVGIDTVILGVARLRQRHGVDAMLLVALGAGDDAREDADANAAADAELARLRDLVRALAMTTHVRLLVDASVTSLHDCHAAADVLVSTPWRTTDAEALAAHLARLQRHPGRSQPVAAAGGAHCANLTVPEQRTAP